MIFQILMPYELWLFFSHCWTQRVIWLNRIHVRSQRLVYLESFLYFVNVYLGVICVHGKLLSQFLTSRFPKINNMYTIYRWIVSFASSKHVLLSQRFGFGHLTLFYGIAASLFTSYWRNIWEPIKSHYGIWWIIYFCTFASPKGQRELEGFHLLL